MGTGGELIEQEKCVNIQIIHRLEQFDSRFAELEKPKGPYEDEMTPPSHDLPGEFIDDLMFHDGPSSGVSPDGIPNLGVRGFPQAFATSFPPGLLASLGMTPQGQDPSRHSGPRGAYIQNLPASENVGTTQHTNDVPSWGSEVELPQPGVAVSPPRAPPTINIQAPTESNLGGKSSRVQSRVPSTQGRSDPKTPRQVDVDIIEQRISQVPDTIHTVERDLPPLPPLDKRSQHSPVSDLDLDNPTSPKGYHTPQKVDTTIINGKTSFYTPQQDSLLDTAAKAENPTSANRASTIRERVNVVDPINPPIPHPAPWELVTQRLYSWALVWEEESFLRALEGISLGRQVGDVAILRFTILAKLNCV